MMNYVYRWVVFGIFSGFFFGMVNAQSVQLAWDANTESDLAGYKIYRSLTPGSGYSLLNAALMPTQSYTDTTVAYGKTYYYVVSAVNISGLASNYSNQVTAAVVDPTPANQPPTANAGPDFSLREGKQGQLNGSAVDPDGDPLSYVWTQISGTGVSLSGANQAVATLTAPSVDVNSTLVFQLTVSDGKGGQSTDQITVTVIANRAPQVTIASSQTVGYKKVVTLTATATDPDGDALSYQWAQTSGASVQLASANKLSATFTTPEKDSTLTFQFSASDGDLSSQKTTQVVVVNTNKAPTADAGADQSIREGKPVMLKGSGSDPDGDLLSYSWSQISGVPVTLSTPNSADTGFTAPQVEADTTLSFQLTVSDGKGEQSTDQVSITVVDNRAPQVTVGASQTVGYKKLVTLTATASDPDGDTLSYNWTQTSGTSIQLTSPNKLSATFTTPEKDGTLVFQFSASDGDLSAQKSTQVVVLNTNQAPTADAGADQVIREGKSVVLKGSGTDPDGDPLSFSWSQISGIPVTLSTPNLAETGFKAPPVEADTALSFQLTVSDGKGGQANDQVSVTVQAKRAPQVGPGNSRKASYGQTVNLEGTATDPDGDVLTYSWTQTSGPAVQLANATSLSTSFVAPQQEATLAFKFAASDGELTSDTTFQVTVSKNNQNPDADAGPNQTVNKNATVMLSGSGSDPDNDTLNFNWTQLSGPAVTINNAKAAQAVFVAPGFTQNTSLNFELKVDDGRGGTATDQIKVLVLANRAPEVNAGSAQTAAPTGKVNLNATATDPDGDPMTYSWTQMSGQSVTLTGAAGHSSSFTAPSTEGTLVFQFSANDGQTSGESTVQVTVSKQNQKPIANAGPDLTVRERKAALLAGSGSDPDGDSLTFLWSQVSGPSVSISAATQPEASFVAPGVDADTSLVFKLKVTDGNGGEATDQLTVRVLANLAPQISAGPKQTVGFDKIVTLSATATDPEGDPMTYQWSQTAGTAVVLEAATALTATFRSPSQNGTLTFKFSARDEELSSEGTIQVVVSGENQNPVAQAGPSQTVHKNDTVILGGSGSDQDDDPLTFSWKQFSGPAVVLGTADQAQASFVAPGFSVNTSLNFELTVEDGRGGKATDTVKVLVLANRGPKVGAEPKQTAHFGRVVILDAIATDADGDDLTYSWKQLSGSAVVLTQRSNLSASFISPKSEETLTFEFTASDGSLSDSARVKVKVVDGNTAPKADAGTDQFVRKGDLVTLAGSGTDTDRDTLTFSWSQVAGPAVVVRNQRQAQANFTAPAVERDTDLVFDLMVEDGEGGRDTDRVTIQVLRNVLPTVDAGQDRSAGPGELVVLSGFAEDPDGDSLAYRWTQISGTTVTLQNADTLRPSFDAPSSKDTLVFELSVNDGVETAYARVSIFLPGLLPADLAVPITLNTGNPLLDGTFIGVAIENPHDQPNQLELSFMTAQGQQVGDYQFSRPLASRGQNAFLTADLTDIPAGTSSVLARGSRGRVQGFFMVGDWDSNRIDGVGGQLAESNRLYFPKARIRSQESTLLYLFNAEPNEGNELSLRLYDPAGVLQQEVQAPLAPSGSFMGTMEDIFGTGLAIEDGYLEVQGSSPLRGFEIVANADAMTSYTAQARNNTSILRAPHFFVDQGGDTEIRLLNTDAAKDAVVSVKAYDDDSVLLGQYEGEIGAKQMFVGNVGDLLGLSATAGPISGHLEVSLDSGSAAQPAEVSGTVTFTGNYGQFEASLPMVSHGETETTFLHVAQSESQLIFTGLAILNAGRKAADVTVEIFDENGNSRGETALQVKPGQRVVDLLNSSTFFGTDFEQVKGHFKVSSSEPVISFALFGDYQMRFLSAIQGR